MSTSLAVWEAGEQQNMSLLIGGDVPHECEVSPLPVHVVLCSNIPNSVKERVRLHSSFLNTEVIWMEEWTEKSLRADDAKRLSQGR